MEIYLDLVSAKIIEINDNDKVGNMTIEGKKDFSGKVAFITGAGSGIGRATAVAFAREGANVVIGYVTKEHAEGTAQLVKEAGVKSLLVKCDVSKDEEVKSAVEKTVQTFGRLDFAFNNAGVMQHRVDTAEITLEEWDRVMAINLRGVFSCMRYEIPQMLKQGRGAIVNDSSIGGVVGNPGLSAYHAAKHGVIGLTRTAVSTSIPFALVLSTRLWHSCLSEVRHWIQRHWTQS
jgi:NAD(P)-dependent dehydrogenase (short-subunit alcohol dehydrogenase family)